jgi:enamine deaminase RidA (YjgF/YER057c/UK114 family)
MNKQNTQFKIEKVLKMVNTSLTNIVRCRIFTKNIDDLKSIGKAHSEFFIEIKPATSMVEVKRHSTRSDCRVRSGCP